ncbi:MAG: M1 family metallopeptidase [Microscillaceae bacterium]|nr:M1 family metallopeptidase [Microscillaceae bacterium]
MKKCLSLFAVVFCINFILAQTPKAPYKSSKFEQLDEILPTPNVYRTGDGSPGPQYWQQKADYKIKAELDEAKRSIKGSETITYYNNSPQDLNYLWVQLDQNRFNKDSDYYKTETFKVTENQINGLYSWVAGTEAEYGYQISNLKDAEGKALKYTINQTMMRIDLPQPLKANGGKFVFSMDWTHNIRERKRVGGRGGYEYFPEDDNCVFSEAQWFPRMAVYDDYDGWQNKQFLGQGEFALTFGDYEVELTLPEDHVVAATGELQNPQDVLSEVQRKRWEQAKTSAEPLVIVTQEEAIANEKDKSTKKKTWKYKAQNVRDYAWASSRKFIWDAMQVEVGGKKVWAMSYYPKESNPLWGDFSTRLVALTLKNYSKYTFNYPYPVAISVEASNGMEYPMICFNYGRPNPDGTINERIRQGMFGVIIHEVGHNFFPMIVNSDERQWTWMDEGINSFLQYLTEQEVPKQPWAPDVYKESFPSRRGPAKNIISYMRTDPAQLVPIMTNSEQIHEFGNNAYGKPATALNILRETVMGHDLFDFAFKQYSQKWMFKHPLPADFFRTMEDASAVDLDWFWRGWFYTTEPCDIAIESVELYRLPKDAQITANAEAQLLAAKYIKPESLASLFASKEKSGVKITEAEKKVLNPESYFYNVSFKNVGGLIMPIILEMKYKDGTSEIVRVPAEVWRMEPEGFTKVFIAKKEVASFVLDPKEETADIDTSNNIFPRAEKAESDSKFKEFKEKQEK